MTQSKVLTVEGVFDSEFRIIAHGRGFDVDSFLSRAELSPTRVWRRGTRSHFEEIACTSGFEILLGEGDVLSVEEQEGIALEYLKVNFDDLHACGTSPSVEFFLLTIHQRVELTDDLCAFSIEISPRLLQLAMELRIRALTHVELVREGGIETE